MLPQILALKDRGIWTNGQLGTTYQPWEISEKAMKQGSAPDVGRDGIAILELKEGNFEFNDAHVRHAC